MKKGRNQKDLTEIGLMEKKSGYFRKGLEFMGFIGLKVMKKMKVDEDSEEHQKEEEEDEEQNKGEEEGENHERDTKSYHSKIITIEVVNYKSMARIAFGYDTQKVSFVYSKCHLKKVGKLR